MKKLFFKKEVTSVDDSGMHFGYIIKDWVIVFTVVACALITGNIIGYMFFLVTN